MENQQNHSKGIHIALWAVQVLLAAILVWSGCIKLLQPIEKLSAMWPWAGQVPAALVRLTGIIDLLAAVGLILPSLLRIQPGLTPMAAIGIIALMLCASIFHIIRGEASAIGINIFFAVLAAFVAWGRLTRARIKNGL